MTHSSDPAKRLRDAAAAGNCRGARSVIRRHPSLGLDPRALLAAAKNHRVDTARLLLEAGADPNAPVRRALPLHSAIQRYAHTPVYEAFSEQLAMVNLLLGHGADPSMLAGWPPVPALALAATVGCAELVGMLVECGCPVDGFMSAATGDLGAVRATVDVDTAFATRQSPSGLRALDCCAASRLGHGDAAVAAHLMEIATLLVSRGAEVDAESVVGNHRMHALAWAISAHNDDLAALLLELGARPSTGLRAALWNGTDVAVDLVFRFGVDPDQPCDGVPLLWDLTRWGQFGRAEGLLRRGASPDIRGRDGSTPLHAAAFRGAAAFIRKLLERGATCTLVDDDGRTPLMIAEEKNRTAAAAVLRSVTGL